MGGQACVFYGAAEFSRDADFAILAEATNLARLRKALAELQAEVIAVPPFELKYLRKGHAIHFRCRHSEASGMRIDVMSKLRGLDSFAQLWKRRTTLRLTNGSKCDLLSLPDLVRAKKTQRDKDWPMLRRLVEANFFENRQRPTTAQAKFWLTELRTPQLLVEVARGNSALAKKLAVKRPLLRLALTGDLAKLEVAVNTEESADREADRHYWLPLRKELEKLRHGR